jgi:hypothetical protein
VTVVLNFNALVTFNRHINCNAIPCTVSNDRHREVKSDTNIFLFV